MSDINQRIAKLSPAQRALLEKKLQEKAAKSNHKQSIPKRTDENPAPLSFSQERMWILDQFEPGNPAYNRPSNIHLVGVLNIPALEQSLNEIVRRHEILRTSFPEVGEKAMQAIAPTLTISLPLVDLSHLPTSERDAEVQRLAIQAAQHKFNLSQLPLIKATLLRLSEEEHILLLTLHHIIFDGWSMGVLLKELAALYDAFGSEKPSPLPALPIQYADFASWQKERLQGEKIETQLAYWKKQLGGDLSVLKLPTDRSRSHSRTFRGGKEVQRLPKTLSESLKALSQQEEVTLFMTLLAAFQTLLYGHTGQKDITVGTPIAGRDRTEIENSIGLFINTLVLRTSLEGNPTFRELLKRVREVALAAETNREIPFEKLVEELKPKRNTHQNSFFQVLFQLRNLPKQSMEVAGIKMEDYPLETGMVMVDLSLELEEQPEGLLIVFKYDTDLFNQETIATIGWDFQTLLRDIVANLDRPIAALTDHLLAKRQHQSFSCYLIGHQSLVIPCAQHLLEKGHQILGIISSGTSIDRWATDQKIPLLQEKDDLVSFLSQQHFDYLFSIYNLSILPKEILKLPQKCAINCHDSLLPKYGGLHAPSWAILNQEKVHGITWHQIDHLIDSGDILKQVTIAIDPNETAFTLIGKCYQAALESFVELIDELQHDTITLSPQNLEHRSYFSISQKPSLGCLLPWHRPAEDLKAWMRALDFGNYQNLLGLPKLAIANTFIIVSQLEVLETASGAIPGTITAIESERLIVATGSYDVALTQMLTLEGKTLSIPELVTRFKLQIGDCFAEIEPTQAQHLKEIETAIAKHESFWVKKLATLQPIASPDRNWLYGNQDIFSPFPSEEMASQNWHILPEIDGFLASNLKGCNLEEFLVAAFAAYLARIIETDDFDLGWRLTTSQRPHGGLENFFAIDVPFRLKIDLKQGIREVVKAVQQQMQWVEQCKTYPRDILLRYPELQELRKLGFQHRFPVTIERGATLDRTSNLSTYGLTFVIPKTGEECRWIYDTAAFDRESFDRFSNSFTIFVRNLVIDSDRPLAELPLISGEERDCLLQQWNSPSSNALTNFAIHQLFEQQVLQCPNSIAVQFENQQLTYAELNARANQLAHYLQEFGIQPEELVGICVERSIEMLVGILGILKAGGAYVPLDPTYPTERLEYIISDAQTSRLLTQEKLLERFSDKGVNLVCLDRDWNAIALASSENLNQPVSPDRLAYAIYTSGSTGQPKGVAIEHQSLVNFTQTAIAEYGINRSDFVLQFASISFDAAAEEIYPCLLSGGTLVLRTDEMLSSVETFLKRCQEWKITVLDLPTAYWQQMLPDLVAVNYTLPESLRLVIIGGERALPQSVKLWQQWVGDFPQLLNTYGPTESTVVATVYQVSTSTPIVQEVPIGRAIANVQTYILDRNLQLVPIGMPGELYIGGAGLARGYLNRPELTAEKFISHPFSQEPNARLYKTGDRVRYLSDGNIEFLGRIDNQIKIRGFRIELGEIETILSQHSGVRDAVVVVKEERDNKHLAAYFVGNGEELTLTELRSFLKAKLPIYMVPSTFIRLDALPLTPSGKINRLALPETDLNQPQLTDIIATDNAIERQLIQIWQEVLKVRSIQINENFFDLGGHSLLATQVISRIRKTLGLELPLRLIFESPTIAQLAQHISTKQTDSYLSIPPHELRQQQENLPLSFAQQRLWFLDQLEPNSTAYNMRYGLRILGSLNVSALEKSISEIIQRHEILRTNFPCINEQPIQAIAPHTSFSLPLINLEALPDFQRQAEAQRLTDEEAQRPFDLAKSSLFRVKLLRLDEAEHLLLFNIHHIIFDGWSLNVFLAELKALYTAFCASQPSSLAKLSIQYADFTLWQKKWLSGGVLNSQLNYWKQQLSGTLPVLELPIDYPRPPIQTYRGAAQHFILSPELTASLKALSHQEGVTLFMMLLAAFKVLLSRYSRQEDIIVGTPIAGRNRKEIEGLIGFFVNSLALRTDLSGNPSFRKVLERVRQVTLGAYTHQDLPFEKLVEELQLERDLSYTPIFQVVFAWQNAPINELKLPNLTLMRLAPTIQTVKFDLTLLMEERDEQLIGRWEYNTDLFEAATVERAIAHFQTLLSGIVADPDRSIGELPLITERERHQLLVEWNQTQVDYPQDKCIHQLFEAQVERTPNAVAIVFEEQQLTYRELNCRANQLAHYLQKLGVKPEVLVGICVERSLEMVIGLLAILKAGGAYVPLDPSYPPDRLAFMLDNAKVSILLTQQFLIEKLPDRQATTVCLDTDWKIIERESQENVFSQGKPYNLAYVIYTSGSTGQPKGVLIPHRGLQNLVFWHQNAFEITKNDRSTQLASSAFDASVWELWPYLTAGATVYLVNPTLVTNPVDLQQWLVSQAITVSFLPTPLAEILLTLEWSKSTQLRLLLTGGDRLRQYPSPSLPFQVVNNYGPTENTVVTTSGEAIDRGEILKTPAIGRPIANTQIYLLDRYGQLVPIGVPGELHIGGLQLARGYLNRPELTAERFIANPFLVSSSELEETFLIQNSKLYKTGDLARYLPDGNLEFLGRIDNQVKIRGFRIELGEIEAVLSQHPDVRETVVILREDMSGDKRLVAYVVSHSEKAEDLTANLRNFIKAQLPAYMVPSAFVKLDFLPLTPSGKIDRRALPAPVVTRQESREISVTPRDELEHQLRQIWEEILKVKPIHISDNFFSLGGHSLLAVKLFSQIKNRLGQDVPVATLFQAPTIEELASILRQKGWTNSWSSLVPIKPNGSRLPFFFHGGAADATTWAKFSHLLPSDRPFYALQHPILNGKPVFQNTVTEMAAHCIKEIRTIQPNGPYFLGGHCFGGIVAFEIAQQLHDRGETIALLALVDAYAPKLLPKKSLFWQTQSLFYKTIFLIRKSYYYHADNLNERDWLEKLVYLSDWLGGKVKSKLKQKLGNKLLKSKTTDRQNNNPIANVSINRDRVAAFSPHASELMAHELRYSAAEKANQTAKDKYVPQVYPEQITLFRAKVQSFEWCFGSRLGWHELTAKEVNIHEIPGFFGNLFNQASLPLLAQEVKKVLEKIQEKLDN